MLISVKQTPWSKPFTATERVPVELAVTEHSNVGGHFYKDALVI